MQQVVVSLRAASEIIVEHIKLRVGKDIRGSQFGLRHTTFDTTR